MPGRNREPVQALLTCTVNLQTAAAFDVDAFVHCVCATWCSCVRQPRRRSYRRGLSSIRHHEEGIRVASVEPSGHPRENEFIQFSSLLCRTRAAGMKRIAGRFKQMVHTSTGSTWDALANLPPPLQSALARLKTTVPLTTCGAPCFQLPPHAVGRISRKRAVSNRELALAVFDRSTFTCAFGAFDIGTPDVAASVVRCRVVGDGGPGDAQRVDADTRS